MKTNRFVCVHGHFYQPPRENPWLGTIEAERSAFPWHDWNSRILHECYGPNSASPLRSASGRFEEIINNYSLMSFNFGPTLLSWLEKNSREAYMAILEADRTSSALRSGHGNAMAQVYNHVIMPLAGLRDKKTQVKWGMEDFSHRFHKKPEGMWLPETAADEETLETLCEYGITFTVLSPSQAARVRRIGTDKWEPANEINFDSTRAYRWFSKAVPGRHIDLFFYNASLARAIAFNGMLNNQEDFRNSLLSVFSDSHSAQLSHVATDGETYGHHSGGGNAALSWALTRIEKEKAARLTNYGEFLEKHPPVFEAEIISPSSWSCGHGVGRWKEDCGCSCSARPGWNQKWRRPLRESLDWLARETDSLYEERGAAFFWDPWLARDEYIHRVLEDSAFGIRKFLSLHARKHLSNEETHSALRLMELQRNRMLMFTSCGWFFDDISGIEPVQILKYASRSVELAGTFGLRLEEEFEKRLEPAESNLPNFGNGKIIYGGIIKPLRVDMKRAAAHCSIINAAAGNLPFPGHNRFHSKIIEETRLEGRNRRLYLACVNIEATDTLEHALYSVAVFTSGEHGVRCHAAGCETAHRHRDVSQRAEKAFSSENDKALLDLLKNDFSPEPLDLSAVFPDQRATLSGMFNRLPGNIFDVRNEWLTQLRLVETGQGLPANLFAVFRKFHAAGMPYHDIPFINETRNYILTHFSLMLEKRSPQLIHLVDWLKFFCQPQLGAAGADSGWGVWEFRSVMHKWLKEIPPGHADPEDFSLAVKEAASILNLHYKHDHKKTAA